MFNIYGRQNSLVKKYVWKIKTIVGRLLAVKCLRGRFYSCLSAYGIVFANTATARYILPSVLHIIRTVLVGGDW